MEERKAILLEALAGKNRGLLGNEIDRVRVLAAVEQLEDLNPTPNPLEQTALLSGNWRLLYTTSRELLGLDRFPLFQLGQIYQCISPQHQRIYNFAEITGLPWLDSLVCVAAEFEPVSSRRVNVNFKRLIFGLQSLLGYRSAAEFIEQLENSKKFAPLDFEINREQSGWLEITYLDDDLRLGRGNEGNVFVLAREKSL
ncbi:MAG: PAP/fibrillin family protein [Cyanobacteria bacterium P01_H01_bin.15]